MGTTTVNEAIYEENIRAFLDGLTELTKKHQIKICGCGCCGSPFLVSINEMPNLNHYHYTVWRSDEAGGITYEYLRLDTVDEKQVQYFDDEKEN